MITVAALTLCLQLLAGRVAAEPVSLPLYHRRASNDLTKRDTARAPIAAWGADAVYSVPVSIGTPYQLLDLALHATLINTYVLENTCTTCTGFMTFEANKSSTWLPAPDNTLAGVGEAGSDTVGIWALPGQSATYTFGALNTTVAAALPRGVVLPRNLTVSGNLGLGPTPANASLPNPLLYELARNWTEKVYGFKLDPARSTAGDDALTNRQVPGGVLTLGGVDNTVLASNITFLPVANVSHSFNVWAVPLEGINIAGSAVRAVQTQPLVAFPDTMGQAIVGTHAVVGELYSHVPGALLLRSGLNTTRWTYNVWVFPAAAVGIGPESDGSSTASSIGLEIVLGGTRYPVADIDFVLKLVTPDELVQSWGATRAQADSAGLWAVGGVQEMDPWPKALPIGFGLGLGFLRNVYTAFQFSPDAVGFGHLTPHAGAPRVIGPGTPRNVTGVAQSPSAPVTQSAPTKASGVRVTRAAHVIACVVAAVATLAVI